MFSIVPVFKSSLLIKAFPRLRSRHTLGESGSIAWHSQAGLAQVVDTVLQLMLGP